MSKAQIASKQFESTKQMLQGMVCFYLDPEVANMYAIEPSGDLTGAGVKLTPPEELHITLSYFEVENEPEEIDRLISAAALAAYWAMPCVCTVVEGVARFRPDGDGPTPIVLLCDPTQLEDLQESLWCFRENEPSDHGFIPHITVAYVPQGYDLAVDFPPDVQMMFHSLSIKIGDSIRHDFPLGGPGMSDMAYAVPAYRQMREKVDALALVLEHSQRPTVDGSQTATGQDMSTATIVKATWSTSYVNDLPDSAFLYVEPGGEKDDEGKTTPRSLRHFPYKDDSGAIDLPHLRNAIARIPQSNAPGLTDDKKQQLQDRARGMLENAQKTTEKAGKRMAGSWREKLSTVFDSLKQLVDWANYHEDEMNAMSDMADMGDSADKQDAGKVKSLSDSFFVIKQDDGTKRWVSFSSNGFEDREQEIIATRALQESVDMSDATGERGPLRLWHIPGADIGQCDFQAIEGRFLIESGTFDTDKFARKALEYLETTDEHLGVSIGFVYPESSFNGRVYQKALIRERSVLPWESAANPWTAFHLLGKDETVNSSQAAWLEKAVGKDLATSLIEKAQTSTKELENVLAFKSKTDVPESLTAAMTKMADAVKEVGNDKLTDAFKTLALEMVGEAPAPADTSTPAASSTTPQGEPQPSADASPTTDATATIDAVKMAVNELLKPVIDGQKDLTDRLAAIEQAATTKSKEDATPRGAAFHASQSNGNVIDDEKVKSLLGDVPDQPTNHVAPYIEDLIKGRAAS